MHPRLAIPNQQNQQFTHGETLVLRMVGCMYVHSWFTLVALTQEIYFFKRKKKLRFLAGPWSDCGPGFFVSPSQREVKEDSRYPRSRFFSLRYNIRSNQTSQHLNWCDDCSSFQALYLSLSTFNPLDEFLRTNTTHGFEPWDQLLSASLFLEWPGY